MKLIKVSVVLLFFSSLSCFSQSLERTVIGSTGNTLTASQANLEFTVGEVAVSEVSNGTTFLGQGFHQGNLIEVLGITEEEFLRLSFYPNPADDFVVIEGLEQESSIEIYDYNGRLVRSLNNYFSGNIDVSNLASATYFISIKNSIGTKVIKLLKK